MHCYPSSKRVVEKRRENGNGTGSWGCALMCAAYHREHCLLGSQPVRPARQRQYSGYWNPTSSHGNEYEGSGLDGWYSTQTHLAFALLWYTSVLKIYHGCRCDSSKMFSIQIYQIYPFVTRIFTPECFFLLNCFNIVTLSISFAGATAKNVAAGADHTCAILNDDRVTCWGRNDFGQSALSSCIYFITILIWFHVHCIWFIQNVYNTPLSVYSCQIS